MEGKADEAISLEAALARAVRDLGFDPDTVKAEISALVGKLLRRGEDGFLPYAEMVKLAKIVPNFKPADGGGAFVVIGNVNTAGKHYRVQKSWATVDGVPVWEHPEARRLKTWRSQAIQELGHEYVPGSRDKLKRYVSVFWVPAGKTVAISRCEHDLYRGRRDCSTESYKT